MGEKTPKHRSTEGNITYITPQILRHRFVHTQLTLNQGEITPRQQRREQYIQALVSAFDYVRLHPQIVTGRAELILYAQSTGNLGEREGFSSALLMQEAVQIASIWRNIQTARNPQ